MMKSQETNKLLFGSGKQMNDEMKIDLIKIFHEIISIRKILYRAIIIGVLIGIIVALSIPRKYTVKVALSPEMGNSKGNDGLVGLAASFLGNGTAVGDGTDALNVSLSSDIVSSTPFLLELLSMQVPYFDENNKITLDAYMEKESSPWWNSILNLPGILISGIQTLFEDDIKITNKSFGGTIELTEKEKDKIDLLKENVSANIDKKTAITYISVTLQNPKVTAVVADSVIHKLKEYIIDYRTSKAKEDCIYLEKLFEERHEEYYNIQKKYAEYLDTHDNLVLQSVRTEQERLQNDMNLAYQVYSQVANQLQVARAKVQEEKPVFAVVEPAVVPLKPSGIGIKFYIVMFVFIALMGTIGWMLLGKRILTNFKNDIGNENLNV